MSSTWEMGWLTYTQPVSGLTRRYSGCSPDIEYVMAALVPKSSSWAATRKKLVPIIVSSRRKSGTEEKGVRHIFKAVRTEYCTSHNVITAVKTVRDKKLPHLKQKLRTEQGESASEDQQKGWWSWKSSLNHAARGSWGTIWLIMFSRNVIKPLDFSKSRKMTACGEHLNRYLNINRTNKLNRRAERGSNKTKTAEENFVWGKHGGQQMTGTDSLVCGGGEGQVTTRKRQRKRRTRNLKQDRLSLCNIKDKHSHRLVKSLKQLSVQICKYTTRIKSDVMSHLHRREQDASCLSFQSTPPSNSWCCLCSATSDSGLI